MIISKGPRLIVELVVVIEAYGSYVVTVLI